MMFPTAHLLNSGFTVEEIDNSSRQKAPQKEAEEMREDKKGARLAKALRHPMTLRNAK